jgi:hypothetical protein
MTEVSKNDERRHQRDERGPKLDTEDLHAIEEVLAV